MPATLKKILADLLSSKGRSILVILSIAVGVFAVGLVASSFSIVKKDMAADYLAINPHTARIYTSDFTSKLLAAMHSVPEVDAIEARYNLWVKIIDSKGRQYPINLDGIGTLDEIQVDQLVFEKGSPILKDGEIYLERQGAEALNLQPGDTADLILNDGRMVTLQVAGIVHDVMSNPFKFTSKTSGYVTHATMSRLGGSSLNNYVSVVTTGSHTDAAHIRQVADRVAAKMTENGITVYNINITNPGQHPAQSIIDTVLMLMGALTVLVIFLSAFLVTNTISALMGQQIRQIGVMKAVGATMGQVMGVYLGLVLSFGILALLIGIPLAGLASYGFSRWLIEMLNATPLPFSIPISSIGLQIFIGLVVPVLGGLIPVIGGARCTVKQAITSYGLVSNGKPGLFDRMLEALPWLSRPLILSLRNTFRRKSRLVLTLATLTLGGAIFIAMFGVRESLYAEIDQSAAYYQADVNVELARSYPLEQSQAAIDGTPGVEAVEGWSTIKANVLHKDGETSDQIVVYAPPAGTRLVDLAMTEGRWLLPSDGNAIVVPNQFVNLRPDVKVGDTIQVRLNEKDTPFTVVGIYRMAGTYPSPFTYVNHDALAKITGTAGQVNSLRIVTDRHDQARQEEVLKAVQSRLADHQLDAVLTTGGEFIAQQRSQINILITLLLAMGLLIATVGGLGLMGTMGMNVLERTREIGVMRSIGARNGAIFQMVVVEGALIGLISWGLSILLAIPITHLLDTALGKQLMTIPILYTFSSLGTLVWLMVALVLSAIASLLPARNAVQLTVRDVLAYE